MAINGESRKYRLSVPQKDASVQKWLDEQINISISIRHLIRKDIEQNGYTDVTCRDIEPITQSVTQPAQKTAKKPTPKPVPKPAQEQVTNVPPPEPRNVVAQQPQIMPHIEPEPAPIPQRNNTNNVPPEMTVPETVIDAKQNQPEQHVDVLAQLSHGADEQNDDNVFRGMLD